VALLDRALYGLRDSPVLWYKTFCAMLEKVGFFRLEEEPCLFYNKERIAYLVVYVDDFLLIYPKSHEQTATKMVEGIKKEYSLTGGDDVNTFLGMRVIRDRESKKLWLVYDQYIEKIAKRFGVDDIGKCFSIPLLAEELVKNLGEVLK